MVSRHTFLKKEKDKMHTNNHIIYVSNFEIQKVKGWNIQTLLTHCLLEPGGPCVKSMGIREFSSQRVKRRQIGALPRSIYSMFMPIFYMLLSLQTE